MKIYTLSSEAKYNLNPTKIIIPGSKSYTNRALILAALAEGDSILNGASQSDDSQALLKALQHLGIRSEFQKNRCLVTGGVSKIVPYKGEINVGPAGTTYRFLVSLLAAIPDCEVVLSGSPRMHARPIGDLVEALRSLGAQIEYLKTEGCPPLRIRGQKLKGGCVEVSGSMSSQFFTSLMLASPLYEKALEIRVKGEQISRSYIDMSFAALKLFDIPYDNQSYKLYKVNSLSLLKPKEVQIESDASGATYFFALAALGFREMCVGNLSLKSAQGDAQFPKLLESMGCKLEEFSDQSGTWLKLSTPTSVLRAIEANMELMPDSAQTLAVVAACAKGRSRLSGLSTLRIKETDRIQALVTELAKCGIQAESGADYLEILGGKPKASRIATYEDHRMAMSFAALTASTGEMEIEEPEVVSKSFPEFWECLKSIGIQVREQ